MSRFEGSIIYVLVIDILVRESVGEVCEECIFIFLNNFFVN